MTLSILGNGLTFSWLAER